MLVQRAERVVRLLAKDRLNARKMLCRFLIVGHGGSAEAQGFGPICHVQSGVAVEGDRLADVGEHFLTKLGVFKGNPLRQSQVYAFCADLLKIL